MNSATTYIYLIALGSNQRHMRYGRPRDILQVAVGALKDLGGICSVSQTITTEAIGPSARRYANSVAMIKSRLAPDALLSALKRIERNFGSRRGRRWSRRVLDLDIILWSGGIWSKDKISQWKAFQALHIPHPAFRTRAFVLGPAAQIAPDWRDPVSGRTVQQLMIREKTGKAA